MNQKLNITQGTKIYIIAPANISTGGPELLHQLGFHLKNTLGLNVFMYYVPNNSKNPIHDNYKEYNIPYVNKIVDLEDNIMITSETDTKYLESYILIQKIIWWLSVDNYFLTLNNILKYYNKVLLKYFDSQRYLGFNRKFKDISLHLVQSNYAFNMLKENNIENIMYLSDYLHRSFLDNIVDVNQKNNIVAYNPKKGYKHTKKIIKKSYNRVKFIPIINMTRNEVVELLKQSKVYIDFGFHPGKDRIPREAAFLMCNVITNKMGSANNEEDVKIAKDYKFSNHEYTSIVDKIEECLNNYEQTIDDFNDYRLEIINQENIFLSQLKKIFLRY